LEVVKYRDTNHEVLIKKEIFTSKVLKVRIRKKQNIFMTPHVKVYELKNYLLVQQKKMAENKWI
jgi:hypothetical protein